MKHGGPLARYRIPVGDIVSVLIHRFILHDRHLKAALACPQNAHTFDLASMVLVLYSLQNALLYIATQTQAPHRSLVLVVLTVSLSADFSCTVLLVPNISVSDYLRYRQAAGPDYKKK